MISGRSAASSSRAFVSSIIVSSVGSAECCSQYAVCERRAQRSVSGGCSDTGAARRQPAEGARAPRAAARHAARGTQIGAALPLRAAPKGGDTALRGLLAMQQPGPRRRAAAPRDSDGAHHDGTLVRRRRVRGRSLVLRLPAGCRVLTQRQRRRRGRHRGGRRAGACGTREQQPGRGTRRADTSRGGGERCRAAGGPRPDFLEAAGA